MNIPTPIELRQLLASDKTAVLSQEAKERLDWITYFVLGNASIGDTCAYFNIARGTFLRWLERFDPRDLTSLEDRPRDFTPRGSAIPDEAMAIIRSLRQQEPLIGKERISELLKLEHGIDLSPSTIGRVIERECLYFADTPLHWRKRMHSSIASDTARHALDVPDSARHINADASADAAVTACACGWCRFKQYHWPTLRRSIIAASIMINIAFAGLLLWSALREEAMHAAPESEQTEDQIHSSLDLPSDGR